MGKWNYRRTWRPKNYYRDQRIPSPPTYYDTEFKLRESWKNNDLPWEERFCISVGIPWEKVVNAKYTHCYDNVLKWNDSAGESTFLEAKKRFWAQINNIPTDVPEPDPDMYNEEIDWNPKIDLELVKQLDLAYFNPDEAEKLESYNATKRNDSLTHGCILGLNDNNNNNSWELNKNDNQDCLKKSENKNVSDPWERGITQDDKEIKDAWEAGGNSSWNNNVTWGHGSRNTGNNEVTLGIGATNSWHYNQYRLQREDGNSKNTWAPNETGWQSSYANTSRGTQQHQASYRQRGNYRDFTSFGRGSNSSCRKREGAHEYTSYKSARVQSEDYRERNQYRR